MEKLFEKYIQKLQAVSTVFTRSLIHEINWKARLIGIKGARGIGKTTLLLQYIKLNHSNELEKTLYISLDSIWFSNNSLVELVDELTRNCFGWVIKFKTLFIFCLNGSKYFCTL